MEVRRCPSQDLLIFHTAPLPVTQVSAHIHIHAYAYCIHSYSHLDILKCAHPHTLNHVLKHPAPYKPPPSPHSSLTHSPVVRHTHTHAHTHTHCLYPRSL